ncbi:MucR family transcriptional regulator [uncultured Agrobacterium sp.]|uniref:MucR family transcriptional regulator n=1 Tax=uncultured Agrobacterium sp. TaxID=157277 RepID=UPI0025F74C49|nr:MucR family transcriptional regulator [uncultured Agrobacterium sp.]
MKANRMENPSTAKETQEKGKILELTASLVSAYASNNKIESQELVALYNRLFSELSMLSGEQSNVPHAPTVVPAVAIEDSVTPDYIYCLEDGQPYKSMKRHLRVKYGLTPSEYRAKWNLPPDYPMVAPNYSKKRSSLAHDIKLGYIRSSRINK